MADVTPYVSRLFIYPIKALDRVEVDRVTILKSGALMSDRQYALFDSSKHFVNGKRNEHVHKIRSQFDLQTNTITLRLQDSDQTHPFHLDGEHTALLDWLSNYFGFPVHLQQNLEMGFPDDTASPGPTIISTATLEAIASWYPGLEVEEVRLRFRSNIEISGVPAFWEDRLFTAVDQLDTAGESTDGTIQFQIGDVSVIGVNPCQRCVVITRDSQTGEAYPSFQKTFVANRQTTLPEWSARSRFNHFYRLAINTRIPESEAGKAIVIGDTLQLSN